MKKEIAELFNELLNQYESSQKTVIYEYADNNEEQELKELDQTIKDYKQRLDNILNNYKPTDALK